MEVNKTLLCIFGRRRVNYGKSILLKKKNMARAFVSSADGCSRHVHGYAVLACRGSSTAWLRSPKPKCCLSLVGVGRAVAVAAAQTGLHAKATTRAKRRTRHPWSIPGRRPSRATAANIKGGSEWWPASVGRVVRRRPYVPDTGDDRRPRRRDPSASTQQRRPATVR